MQSSRSHSPESARGCRPGEPLQPLRRARAPSVRSPSPRRATGTALFTDGSATNGITDLAHALDYANAYGGIGHVTLVPGREPFRLRD